MSQLDPDKLCADFAALRAANEKIRTLNAAQELGVSEGELTAARVGQGATRLTATPIEILQALEPLGAVMGLTRNADCVHERIGVYQGASFERHGPMVIGLFTNPDIDLRLFMQHWQFCFALTEGGRKSLQFFDQAGVAVHKIYLTPQSDAAAYAALVARFACPEQSRILARAPYAPPKPFADDAAVDWQGFRADWEALQDTHDFVLLLRKYNISRTQALTHIGSDFAYQIPSDAPRRVLDLAAEKQCEIMVFVGNRGCIQIHTGGVENLSEAGEWYNVRDAQFHMHLREAAVAAAWVTRKPTEDGIVTAVEVFDAQGELIATFFGKRKPGLAELALWREIVGALPNIAQAAE